MITVSCKKASVTSDLQIPSQGGKSAPIPAYIFDWENETYLPSLPANSIPMPWNSGTTSIDPDIAADYKKADGWVLVYNTFTPTTPLSNYPYPYMFALYNKYRGLLRFYIWQLPTTTFSTYLNHGLSLYSSGPTSSMLNFEVNDVTDISTNQSAFSKITNQHINANGGTWFALQYEIAYDASITSTSFPNFGLALDAKYVNLTDIRLDGSQTGTLEGTISTPASSFSLGGGLVDVAKGSIEAFGLAKIDAVLSPTQTVVKLKDAIKEALKGSIKGFFSAIIGGGSGGSTQNVKLTMNTKIQLAGTATSSGGLVGIKLAFPGQLNSQTANGLVPAYDNVMGVFNLSSKPIITRTMKVNNPNTSNARTIFKFEVDQSSIQKVLNPFVNSVADIVQVSTEVVLINPTFNLKPTESTSGRLEDIGDKISYTGKTITVNKIGEDIDVFAGTKAVRITLDVIPKDGSPKTRLVKTFLCNQ